MTTIQSKHSHHSAFVRSRWSSALLFVLVGLLTLATSCSDDDEGNKEPTITGVITSYNEFGAAMLDFTEADMTEAGFTLGDVISITVDDKVIIMPYYDGYYSRNGEYLCVAYPTYPSICFTANNIGLSEELTGLEGHTVFIKMVEKGGRRLQQTTHSCPEGAPDAPCTLYRALHGGKGPHRICVCPAGRIVRSIV